VVPIWHLDASAVQTSSWVLPSVTPQPSASLNSPFSLSFSIRLFLSSAIHSAPCESMATPRGELNCSFPAPLVPTAFTNVPLSLSSSRRLLPVSTIHTLPLPSRATPLGSLNSPLPEPEVPTLHVDASFGTGLEFGFSIADAPADHLDEFVAFVDHVDAVVAERRGVGERRRAAVACGRRGFERAAGAWVVGSRLG